MYIHSCLIEIFPNRLVVVDNKSHMKHFSHHLAGGIAQTMLHDAGSADLQNGVDKLFQFRGLIECASCWDCSKRKHLLYQNAP